VSTAKHFTLSLLILVSTGTVAYLVPATFNVFAFVGGTFSTILSVTFPFMLYYKLNGPYKYTGMILGTVFTILGLTAAVISLLDVVGVLDLTFVN
jgi:amino acid permease